MHVQMQLQQQVYDYVHTDYIYEKNLAADMQIFVSG